jgi:acyl-CoA synthetase (AMP-forming)/AMP-acid ligase II
MGYPRIWAEKDPHKPAVIMAGIGSHPWPAGFTVTYGEIDERSNRLARYFRSIGLGIGGHVAIFAENHPRYLETCWAAERSGLYFTAINSHLTADEVAYIVDDCGARVLVTSAAKLAVARAAIERCPKVEQVLVYDDGLDAETLDDAVLDDRVVSYGATLAAFPATPVDDETCGASMLYSSGTTGRPKGIVRPLSGASLADKTATEATLQHFYAYDSSSIYLSPAPLYHAAPLGFNMTVLRLGGTTVVMEQFDPRQFLRLIADYGITHTQVVPTMFVRLLKLSRDERDAADLSSLVSCVHASAPCPVWAKEQMIEWWDPLGVAITEYYGGTELNGLTFIYPEEWMRKKGSVGKSILGRIRILDETGAELPPGQIGSVYFADGGQFEYHNDSDKTASTFAPDGGGTTIGDIGFVDDEGYLFLTDRKAFMIISGGVNIYPQEIEDLLIEHPHVVDVAVFGVPDDDLGESVKAVVQLEAEVIASPAVEAELIEYCHAHLAHFKCPRSIDFEAELPRLDTGKLYKRVLRDRYWSAV